MKNKILITFNVIEFLFWLTLFCLYLFYGHNFQDFLQIISDSTVSIERKIQYLGYPLCFLVGFVCFGLTTLTLIKRDVSSLNNISRWSNVLILLILLIGLVYSTTGNKSVIKNIIQVQLIFSVFFLVLPCWWNLRVLKRMSLT
jgi:cytosine/uracil/thiamine/allantoin permease